MATLMLLRIRFWLDRIGPIGWIGLLLLLAAATLAGIGPPLLNAEADRERTQIEQARSDILRARAHGAAIAAPTDAQSMLASLPPLATVPAFIEGLHEEASRRGLDIDRAEYRQTQGTTIRLQVQVPVRGEYPALRRWLETLLQRHPSLALDEMVLKRVSPGGSAVEARVSLSYYARITP